MRHSSSPTARVITWALTVFALGLVGGGGTLGQEEGRCGGGSCRGNGGWSEEFSPELDTGICNIPRVRLVGGTDQLHKSGALDKPVIFQRESDDNWVFRNRCRREDLLRRHGDDVVTLSSANTYSYDKKRMPLREYLEGEHMRPSTPDTRANETWYMFGDNDHEGWSDVFEAYVQPPYYYEHELLTGYETALSFGIGASGTGVPFHVHGAGFSEVLWGRKRWFLMPEGVVPRFDPNRTTLWWLNNDYETNANMTFAGAGLLDCIIVPGEILWFPANWYHATLNIGETVFMSTFI